MRSNKIKILQVASLIIMKASELRPQADQWDPS